MLKGVEGLPQRLLYRLAAEPWVRGGSGGFVSGARLSEELGVTRSAVWKAAMHLREAGVEIDGLPRQGYRLATPCSPLTATGILDALPANARARLHRLEAGWRTQSTNADLLAAPPPPGRLAVRVAELQTAGRGRRGRSWLAAPGGSLCLSWAWRFDSLPAHAGSLSLAIALAAADTLERLGFPGVSVKWPNDLVGPEGKLAGILIETVSESAGPALVVIGIGLNLAIGRTLRESIRAAGRSATDLLSLGDGRPPPPRDRLAAALVGDGLEALLRWEREGFAPLVGAWQARDALRDREIVVTRGAEELRGVARGVDDDGSLLVDGADGAGTVRCSSGEATLARRP